MSKRNFKILAACYFVFLIMFVVGAYFEMGHELYPSYFWPFSLLVMIVIGPTVLRLYPALLCLRQEVASLKEQIESLKSGGSEN
jgi:hypothetical protein